MPFSTKNGAKFKARALQFCLEDDVNILRDEDWIVHLDEETLLSENAVSSTDLQCSTISSYRCAVFSTSVKMGSISSDRASSLMLTARSSTGSQLSRIRSGTLVDSVQSSTKHLI